MTGFFSGTIGSHKALSSAPASIDPPPCPLAQWIAASRLAHSHATPPSTPPNDPLGGGLRSCPQHSCSCHCSVSKKTKTAKRKRQARGLLGARGHKRPERGRPVTLKPAPAEINKHVEKCSGVDVLRSQRTAIARLLEFVVINLRSFDFQDRRREMKALSARFVFERCQRPVSPSRPLSLRVFLRFVTSLDTTGAAASSRKIARRAWRIRLLGIGFGRKHISPLKTSIASNETTFRSPHHVYILRARPGAGSRRSGSGQRKNMDCGRQAA